MEYMSKPFVLGHTSGNDRALVLGPGDTGELRRSDFLLRERARGRTISPCSSRCPLEQFACYRAPACTFQALQRSRATQLVISAGPLGPNARRLTAMAEPDTCAFVAQGQGVHGTRHDPSRAARTHMQSSHRDRYGVRSSGNYGVRSSGNAHSKGQDVQRPYALGSFARTLIWLSPMAGTAVLTPQKIQVKFLGCLCPIRRAGLGRKPSAP